MEGIAKLLFLMCLGGLIAFLGDRIGKYIGKRKLTIFNLRPRITSQIFTVIFGMLISLTTFMILAGISKGVRQTLFEVQSLEAKRQKLEGDILQLSRITTMNELIFHVNQPIVMGSIQGGGPPGEIEKTLLQFVARANQVAIARSNEAGKLQALAPLNNQQLVVPQKIDLERAVADLSKTRQPFAVLIYALRNSYFREKVIVGFDLRPNKKIYRAGQSITSISIKANESSDQILVDLFSLLSQLQQAALDAGMLPDPVTNNFGGNILVATLFDKRDQIKSIRGKAQVSVIANKDLYTLGPLDVRFDVQHG